MAMIESHVKALKKSFGKMRPPMPEAKFEELYANKDYAGMISLVKKSMSLDVRLQLGLVNSGGPKNALAWVGIPNLMPLVGTSAFRNMMLTLWIRKEYIQKAPCGTLVASMAHEMSHVVLSGTWHSLRHEEEAVDLTAMLLGFQDYLIKYSTYQADAGLTSRGYLTRGEYIYAASLMARD